MFSANHRGDGKDDGREANTNLPRLHCGNLPLEFDRPFISCAAASASAALVLAEGSGYPRRRPPVASMHGKPGCGFRGDTLGAVVLGCNLDVDAPAAAFNIEIFKLRVRVLHAAILDG